MRSFGLRFTNFTLTRRQRALLAAALVALGPAVWPARAQVDLAVVRARAEQGDPEALNLLGNAFANGRGVAQDFSEAIRLYQRAAERGLAEAQFNLGMAHELGRGVGADLAGAFAFYRKAAEQGFAPAQFNVGNMYANGLGVKQDFFEAVLWFRQGAEAGVPEAQYNLALAYEVGRGVAQDEVVAQKWYRAAAAQGYARARYNLALMLEEGRGSAVDLAAATELYRAAALQNYAPAQNNLGIILAEGRGGPADLTQAYAWLALAAENGAKPLGRDAVAQQFTAAQLAEANIAVAKLRAHLGGREAPAKAPAGPAIAVAAPVPAVPPAENESDSQARLAAVQSDLGNLLIEYTRVSAVAQALAREKAALEKQLAATTESRGEPATATAAAATAGAVLTAAQLEKFERMQDALNDARAENARLVAAVETVQRERATSDERIAASAQLLQRERVAFQERIATAEAAVVAARVGAKADAAEPAVELLRTQLAQLTRDHAALREEKLQVQGQLADLAAQLAAARAAVTAVASPREVSPSPGRAAAVSAATVSAPADENRIAKLVADNARLNDDVRRSVIQLSAINRQLRTAQDRLAKFEAVAPREHASPMSSLGETGGAAAPAGDRAERR